MVVADGGLAKEFIADTTTAKKSVIKFLLVMRGVKGKENKYHSQTYDK